MPSFPVVDGFNLKRNNGSLVVPFAGFGFGALLTTAKPILFRWGNGFFRGALRNVVKKQQAIECLDPDSVAGRALVPELTAMAADQREFVRLRELALRYIYQHVPLTTEKSNLLVTLTSDAKLGNEASRYLQALQREFRNEELDRIAKKMDNRSREATREGMEAVPESLFEEGRSLWEAGR